MNHLELTIADLRAARNRADMLINGLLEFQAGCDGNATEPTAVAPVAPPEQSKTAVPQGTAKQGKPHKNAPKERAVAVKLFKVAQTLAEPFTPMDLATKAKADRKQCENFIVHRVVKKMFTRGERGQYNRGPKFPYVTMGMGDFMTEAEAQKPAKVAAAPIKVRKLGERPGLVPMAREETRPTISKTPTPTTTTQALLDGKATSVGGAMKVYIRQHPKFAGADLLAFLQKDLDYAKLLEQASPSAVLGNLGYWANQGYLDRAGGSQVVDSTYTVTAVGKEWFAK